MTFKLSNKMIGWIIFIAGAVALIGSQVLRERGAQKNEQQDTNIDINKIDIQKLADEFRTFQQLNRQDKFESYIEEKYGLTKVGFDKLLSDNILNSKSKLNKAYAYYLSNDVKNAIPIFTELITETNHFRVRAISNSYLGRIEFSKGNLSKESLNYLLEAEKLFDILKAEDEGVNKVRASNFYDLGFYYKTHSHNFKLSQTYYQKSIKIYESLNDTSSIYSSKLGTVYNDLYILTKEGSLEGNLLLLLQRAIFYKRESLNAKYDYETFINYINSLKILGNYYRQKEDFPNAIEQFKEAIKLIDDKILEYPSDKIFKINKAEVLIRFGEFYLSKYENSKLRDDLTEAKNKLDLVELIYRQNTSNEVSLFDVMQFRQYYYSKGRLSRHLNDYPQAVIDFNTCLEQAEILISYDNKDIDYIIFKAHVFYELAHTYYSMSSIQDCIKAKNYANKALEIYEQTTVSRKFYKKYADDCIELIKRCN